MKLNTPRPMRWLRRIAYSIVAILIVLYVVLPVGFGVAAVFPGKESVGTPPDGFAAVALTADDGVSLAEGSREGLRRYAGMLARHGYGVLAIDSLLADCRRR